MNRHYTALALAVSALLLGISGDLLLRWVPWGVNVPIWTVLFVILAVCCSVQIRKSVTIVPALCAIVAAAGIAWRDSPVLRAVDVLLLLVFLPMLALHARGVRLARAGVSEVGLAVATTAVQTAAGFPQLLFSDVSWAQMPRGGTMRAGGVMMRGLVIATPALVLFAALLMSADAAFADLMKNIFRVDARDAVRHLVVTAVLAAVCAGFLRSLFFSGEMPRFSRPAFLTLPTAESNVALLLINVLFAAFVAVQFSYFFRVTSPASIAQYARRGFFELVGVVALVLPMLLAAEWLVVKNRLFRILALVQIALVLVIAASAWRRMQLYRDAFGLTQLRLYTTAFMLWLAVLLVWFALTVLTGRRARFAIGAVATAMIVVVTLHAINPDALIVTTNLARAEAGRRPFDALYAATLSDDAAPVILANREAFAADPAALHAYVQRPRTIGWRTWNYSRARAIRLLASSASSLKNEARPLTN